jgi:hypothetical protein
VATPMDTTKSAFKLNRTRFGADHVGKVEVRTTLSRQMREEGRRGQRGVERRLPTSGNAQNAPGKPAARRYDPSTTKWALRSARPSRAHPGQRRLLPASLSSRRPRRLWLCERETARQRRSERDADGRRRGGSTRWTRSCPSSPCSSYRPVARRRPSCRRRVGYRTPTRFDHRLPPSAGARLYLYSLSSTDVNTLGNATSRPCTGGGSRDRLPDSLHLVPASSCTVTSEIATP